MRRYPVDRGIPIECGREAPLFPLDATAQCSRGFQAVGAAGSSTNLNARAKYRWLVS